MIEKWHELYIMFMYVNDMIKCTLVPSREEHIEYFVRREEKIHDRIRYRN